jgi:hypothetical protein
MAVTAFKEPGAFCVCPHLILRQQKAVGRVATPTL